MEESIKEKIEKVLFSDNVIKGFDLLHNSGELQNILPELDAIIGFEQFDEEHTSEHHHLDLYHHTLEAVQNTDKNQQALRWAALFHDFGKAANDKDGNPIRKEKVDQETGKKKYTFIGHDKKSGEISEDIMKRLKFDEKSSELIKKLVTFHERDVEPLIQKEKNMIKFLNDFGTENVDELVSIKTADINAQKPETRKEKLEELRTFEKYAGEISKNMKQAQNAPKGPELPVTNSDLIKFIPPGPGIKEAMTYLKNIYKDGMSRDELLIAAKQELITISQKYPEQQKQQGKNEVPDKRGISQMNKQTNEKQSNEKQEQR